MKFEIGQQLYFVPNPFANDKQKRLLTIEKVGNRWLTLSNGYRADKDTLEADGGNYSSPGRCWLSQQEYDAAVAVSEFRLPK